MPGPDLFDWGYFIGMCGMITKVMVEQTFPLPKDPAAVGPVRRLFEWAMGALMFVGVYCLLLGMLIKLSHKEEPLIWLEWIAAGGSVIVLIVLTFLVLREFVMRLMRFGESL